MSDLRSTLRLYVGAVLIAAAIALLAAFAVHRPEAVDPMAVLFLAAFAFAAQIRPLHLSSKLKIDVDDTATFAAALLFDPLYAMALGGGTMLLSRLWSRREPWYGHAFNVAVVMLAIGASSAVYRAVAGSSFADAKIVAAALAAGVALYVVRTLLVDLVVALHLRRDPRATWRRLHQRAIAQTLALYLLGALAALVVEVEPWALALVATPVALIYVSLREVSRVRNRTRDAIFELADLLDRRDPHTYGHSQRVAEYSERVARHMRLSPAQVDLVRESGRLHDLGKIGTPDAVLRKPSALAGHELVAMQAHAEYGARILSNLPDFWEGAALVAAHHERKDGRGYPRGLRGDEIPLEVAIIAVADAYDAMATARPYRPAMTWTEIRRELEAGGGTQWDASVVTAFLETMAPLAVLKPPSIAAAV
jgi:putative nucleotidyltransferase with HDIG domain